MTFRKLFLLLACTLTVAYTQAQDTCFVALRIDNKVAPFEIKPDKNGQPTGMLYTGLNGDLYLHTNKKIIKVINESSSEMRDKNTGAFRVITFERGNASVFDYTNKTTDHNWAFTERNVNNFQNSIYFSGEVQNNVFSFQLENNTNYRRMLRTRRINGEFDGLKGLEITVATEKGDTILKYADSEKVDTLALMPGESIKSISATRGMNGQLSAIKVDDVALKATYTFRNKQGNFESDNYTARNATLSTSDAALSIVSPCTIAVEYSYQEGDGNAVTEQRRICVIEGSLNCEEEETSYGYIIIAVLLCLALIGYFVRRYYLKKKGIIPESDAEKVVRLTKAVTTHTQTINSLKQTESNLLADKNSLQQQVQKLNSELSTSKKQTQDKAVESDGYRDALMTLQKHTDSLQLQLNQANDRIKVFESNKEHVENLALNQQISELHQEIDDLKRNDAEKLRNTIVQKDEECAKAVAAKQKEMQAALQKVENELKSSLAMREDELNASLVKKQEELNNLLAKTQQELADTKLALSREKNDALAQMESENVAAYDQMKRELSARIALLTQERLDDADKYQEKMSALQQQTDHAIAQVKEDCEQQIADFKTKAEAEVAEAKAKAEREIADMRAKTDKEVSDIKAKADMEVANARSKAETDISRMKAESEQSIAAAQEATKQVAAASKLALDKAQTEGRASTETALREGRSAILKLEEDMTRLKEEYEQKLRNTIGEYESKLAATIAEKNSAVATANAEKTEAIEKAENEKNQLVAQTLAEKTAAINQAETEKNNAIAKANAEKSSAIAQAEAEKSSVIAKAEEDLSNAIAKAEAEKTAVISAAEAEKTSAINAAQDKAAREIASEQEKTRTAMQLVADASRNYIAELQISLDKVCEQIGLLQTEVSEAHVENNYSNVVSHMSMKVSQFQQWFLKEIVEDQENHQWSNAEVGKLMNEQVIPVLTNNYSWLSELVRFYSYASINRLFMNEFRKSGIPVEYIKNAYAETCTLLGKLGITLLVPSLYTDEFDKEIHKLNNAPLINSYYPHGFIEFKPENRGLIYDLLRPGYAVNSEVKQLPEVCVF